nr:hypothetical protein [bacterium]
MVVLSVIGDGFARWIGGIGNAISTWAEHTFSGESFENMLQNGFSGAMRVALIWLAFIIALCIVVDFLCQLQWDKTIRYAKIFLDACRRRRARRHEEKLERETVRSLSQQPDTLPEGMVQKLMATSGQQQFKEMTEPEDTRPVTAPEPSIRLAGIRQKTLPLVPLMQDKDLPPDDPELESQLEQALEETGIVPPRTQALQDVQAERTRVLGTIASTAEAKGIKASGIVRVRLACYRVWMDIRSFCARTARRIWRAARRCTQAFAAGCKGVCSKVRAGGSQGAKSPGASGSVSAGEGQTHIPPDGTGDANDENRG